MITSKQRAFLRSLANDKNSTIQIGKSGISENLIKEINASLEKNEIVKIHVLENALLDTKAVFAEVAQLTGAEQVQAIGRKFVLYKQSKENKTIDLKNLRIIEKKTEKKENKPKVNTTKTYRGKDKKYGALKSYESKNSGKSFMGKDRPKKRTQKKK